LPTAYRTHPSRGLVEYAGDGFVSLLLRPYIDERAHRRTSCNQPRYHPISLTLERAKQMRKEKPSTGDAAWAVIGLLVSSTTNRIRECFKLFSRPKLQLTFYLSREFGRSLLSAKIFSSRSNQQLANAIFDPDWKSVAHWGQSPVIRVPGSRVLTLQSSLKAEFVTRNRAFR